MCEARLRNVTSSFQDNRLDTFSANACQLYLRFMDCGDPFTIDFTDG